MRKLKISALCFAVTMFGGAFAAQANTTASVGSPKVSTGRASTETTIGYSTDKKGSPDDERLRATTFIDYGFNDFYAVRISAAGDKKKGEDAEYEGVTFQNRFHILQAKDTGFDFGVRANYSLRAGDKKPDSVAFGMYELVPFTWGEFRANQIFSHQVGQKSDSGIGADIRFQLVGNIGDGQKLGVESFSNFGNLRHLSGYSNQRHTFGPVLKGKLINNFSYETGYRVGVSKAAPDHNFKLLLNYSFN